MARSKSRLFALIAAIWLTVCHGSFTSTPDLVRQTFLPVKPDDYSGLAWPTEEGLIVGTQTPFRATAVFDLSLVSMAGTVSRLPLPQDHACDVFQFGPKYNITDYQFPTLLPDGRVAIR